MTVSPPAIRFSVVIPAFNSEATIERVVRSVLAQQADGWELIVIDDCSTDRTASIVDSLGAGRSNVRLVRHSVNRGVAAARNSGINVATGELIAFVDSDDECLPNYLTALSESFEEDIDVVLGGREIVLGAAIAGSSASRSIGTFTGSAAVRLAMLDRLSPFPWDKMFRRSLFNEIRFPEGLARFEDMMTNIVLYSRARRVRSISIPVYRYYVSANSLTWGRVPEVDEGRQAIQYLEDFVPAELVDRKSFRSMRTLVTMLVAQSAIARGRRSLQQSRVVNECRAAISFIDWVATLIATPRIGLAAALLIVSPAVYARLYLRYIERTFGLGDG